MLVMLTNFSQTFFGTSLTTCKHYQKRIALQGVFLDGDSSQLGKGAGHNRVNMLKVLSSERTLCAKHPFVEGLTQWKVKLIMKKNLSMICYCMFIQYVLLIYNVRNYIIKLAFWDLIFLV